MTTIELESLVPLSGGTTPVVWIENDDHDELEAQIGGHPTVQSVERIERLSERSLYALEWTVEYDHLFRYIRDEDIHLLVVEGSPEEWRWTLRFRTHTSLSAFQDYCDESRIALDVRRVYNIPEQQTETEFGVTAPQREALILAVREGYYDLPHETNTTELGDQLRISDQAVTERLRRGIGTLVRNMVMSELR